MDTKLSEPAVSEKLLDSQESPTSDRQKTNLEITCRI